MCLLRMTCRLFCLFFTCVAFTFIGIALKLILSKKGKKHHYYITVLTRYWACWFCFFLNIHIKIIGNHNPSSNALIVSNHVGSPDIFVLGSCFETFFVSKNDVSTWPLVGYLAGLGATIFVDRSRRIQVLSTIYEIQCRLQDGFSVTIFPEGRATNGADVLQFKPSHFQSAVLSKRPVLPIMIHYLDSNTPSIACWHNMGFFSHMVALLKNEKLEVRVYVFPEIPWKDDRRFLANESHRRIQEAHQSVMINLSLNANTTFGPE